MQRRGWGGRRDCFERTLETANRLPPSSDVVQRLRCRGDKDRVRARRGVGGEDRRFFRAFRRVAGPVCGGDHSRRITFARELALTLLREAEDAGRGHRSRQRDGCLGLIAFFFGDFLEARDHCERALDACGIIRARPKERDRFGEYRSCVAIPGRNHVAFGRGRTRTRIDQLGNPVRDRDRPHWGDCRCALLESYLEVLRGDPVATLSAAEALGPSARTWDGAVLQRGRTVFRLGAGPVNDPMAGAAQVRRALAALPDQGVRLTRRFYADC